MVSTGGADRADEQLWIASGDIAYLKVVRFRCDCPGPLAEGVRVGRRAASGYAVSGVLGILDCSTACVADFDEDHAVVAVKKFDAFFT